MSSMFPEDIASALGGGGGMPPAGPGGPMPPDIMAALGGAAGGPPPEEGAPAPEGDPEEMYAMALEATDDPETLIRWSLEMTRKAASMEQDDEDTLRLEKATTGLAEYLATMQKESDGLLQGKATPKSLRRASGAV